MGILSLYLNHKNAMQYSKDKKQKETLQSLADQQTLLELQNQVAEATNDLITKKRSLNAS